MRQTRLYLDQPLHPGERLRLDGDAAQRLVQVLRARRGDRLAVFNGDGQDFAAEVLQAGRRQLELALGPPGEVEPPPVLVVELLLGISKGERMDYALQKAVELGVSRVQPITTARSVVRLDDERRERKQAHWQGVVVSACEQSGRRRLPVLEAPQALHDALPAARGLRLLLDPNAAQGLPALPAPEGPVTLLIGPEGGLSETEREFARREGFTGVRLGPRILRTETAPLAAIAALQVLWGDFR